MVWNSLQSQRCTKRIIILTQRTRCILVYEKENKFTRSMFPSQKRCSIQTSLHIYNTVNRKEKHFEAAVKPTVQLHPSRIKN